MKKHFLEQIEDAAFNAWPPAKEMLYDGWLLRFTGGPSKRVNSINIRYPSNLPLEEKILFCETTYVRLHLPVIFRIPELFSTPELTTALSNRGYGSFDPTLILGREICPLTRDVKSETVQEVPLREWMAVRVTLGHLSSEESDIYQGIIERIAPEKVLLIIKKEGTPVACGMAVLEGDLLGYFSIYVHETQRRLGHATTMMAALAEWGLSRGAKFGYLQVEGDNATARGLYTKLGFDDWYRYDYYRMK